MPQRPLTILIPTYNPGGHLRELLESIALASLSLDFPIQVELSDDRSPHPPADFSDPCAKSSQLSVRLHTNESNLGEAGNVNHAVARLVSQGCEWLMLMHQDDFVNHEWLRRCHAYVSNWGPNLPEMVFVENTGIYSLDALPKGFCNHNGPLEETDFVDIPPFQTGLDYISDHWAWIPSGTLFRGSAFHDMSGFFQSLRYAGDNDFLVRWVLGGRPVRQVHRKLVYKRLHHGSSTSRCMINGWDNECWCYLLLRYVTYKTPARNIQDHMAWLYRNARVSLSAVRRRDLRLFLSRVNGVTIGLRSLLASQLPFLQALLPRGIRRLLSESPPIKLRSPAQS